MSAAIQHLKQVHETSKHTELDHRLSQMKHHFKSEFRIWMSEYEKIAFLKSLLLQLLTFVVKHATDA